MYFVDELHRRISGAVFISITEPVHRGNYHSVIAVERIGEGQISVVAVKVVVD